MKCAALLMTLCLSGCSLVVVEECIEVAECLIDFHHKARPFFGGY